MQRLAKTRGGFVVLAALSIFGCTHVSITQTGAHFAASPANCKVNIEFGDANALMARITAGSHVQVGNIFVDGGGTELDDAMRDRLQKEGCSIGGDMVLITSTVAIMGGSGLSAAVLRATSTQASSRDQ